MKLSIRKVIEQSQNNYVEYGKILHLRWNQLDTINKYLDFCEIETKSLRNLVIQRISPRGRNVEDRFHLVGYGCVTLDRHGIQRGSLQIASRKR